MKAGASMSIALGAALAFVGPFVGCGGGPSTPSTATTTTTTLAPPPSAPPVTGTLLFSDDFESGDLARNWVTGGNPNTIVVMGGRVQSTANGNWIETRQALSGNLRVEVDVEKEAVRNHGCWDFIVDLRAPRAQGVVLFDTRGVDAIDVYMDNGQGCTEGHRFTMPGDNPNRATATLTYVGGTARFRLVNSSGRSLETDVVAVGTMDRGAIRIWLAAYSDAPRFIDNVRVFVP